MQSVEAFLEDDPGQQDGGGGVERAQHGGDVDPPGLGSQDVEAVPGDIDDPVDQAQPPDLAGREGRLAGEQGINPEGQKAGETGGDQRPEEGMQGGAVDDEEVAAEEKAREQGQAQVADVEHSLQRGVPVACIGL